MLKITGLVAILGCTAVAGCGSDSETPGAQQGTAGASQSGTAGSSAGSGSAQGGSLNAGGNGVTGDVDGSADDGGPFSLPDLDTACSGGPTGKQLLALIHLPYAGTFTPPKRAAEYPWNGPMTPSALTVGAEYKSGAILCTVDHYVCPGGGVPCRVQMPPTISVDLDVTFKTADGVLNEAFTATVHYASNISSVGFQADLPASKIVGTYPIVTGTKEQVKLVFSGQFEGAHYNGSISEVMDQKVSIPGGSWMETAVGGASDASTDH
jgi:hypothetical protein